MKKINKGFTLIELLVVVLIIGILAAVALPQYQLAVAKARAKSVLPVMRAIMTAETEYYLANGEYSINFEELTFDLPGATLNTDKDLLTLPDGTRYLLSNQGSYPHVRTTPTHLNIQIYSAFPTKYWLCYPQGNSLGKKLCKNLGCAADQLDENYCRFTP